MSAMGRDDTQALRRIARARVRSFSITTVSWGLVDAEHIMSWTKLGEPYPREPRELQVDIGQAEDNCHRRDSKGRESPI